MVALEEPAPILCTRRKGRRRRRVGRPNNARGKWRSLEEEHCKHGQRSNIVAAVKKTRVSLAFYLY